jgi:hypothetical protein
MNFALALLTRCAGAAAFFIVVATAAGCASTSEPLQGASLAPGASPAADPWYAGGGVKARKPARDFDFPIFESAQ